jgi:hypothetical protein
MAAIAYAFTQPLGMDSTGHPIIEARYFITDPAQQNMGTGYDAKSLSVVVVFDPLNPFGWDQAIEDAIIANSAAQVPPWTVAAVRCLTPVYSDALLKDSHNYAEPVSGFSLAIGNNVEGILLNPAAVLATGTVTMPGNPQNGRVVKIASTNAITALTLAVTGIQVFAPGAALTTLAANSSAAYIYRTPLNTWMRWV